MNKIPWPRFPGLFPRTGITWFDRMSMWLGDLVEGVQFGISERRIERAKRNRSNNGLRL